MHSKTYPVTLAPRDEELSLSSSKEKSSEFDWLEIKITRKQKYIGKTEQGSVYSIYLYIYITYGLHDFLRTSSRELYIKKITKQNI